ncbi:MAG: hypothetical protein U0892_17545 [Pirellulales bacterium]
MVQRFTNLPELILVTCLLCLPAVLGCHLMPNSRTRWLGLGVFLSSSLLAFNIGLTNLLVNTFCISIATVYYLLQRTRHQASWRWQLSDVLLLTACIALMIAEWRNSLWMLNPTGRFMMPRIIPLCILQCSVGFALVAARWRRRLIDVVLVLSFLGGVCMYVDRLSFEPLSRDVHYFSRHIAPHAKLFVAGFLVALSCELAVRNGTKLLLKRRTLQPVDQPPLNSNLP